MSSKIIVSGNGSYGLGKSIYKTFPQAKFCSRTNGFDFLKTDDRYRFAEMTLQYSTYISCSSLEGFAQTLLLETVYKVWEKHSHQGHIIAIGSSADVPVKGTAWIYPVEKKSLRSYMRNLSQRVLGGHGTRSNHIRTTYLSPGYLDTPEANEKHPGVRKLDCDYVAGVIAWLLSQPSAVNISELSLDPLQD